MPNPGSRAIVLLFVVALWVSVVPVIDAAAPAPGERALAPATRGGGPAPANTGPVACIAGGSDVTANEGTAVPFDGTCSYDPDGVIVSYAWDFDLSRDSDGDGNPANDVDATGAMPSFTWYDDYVSEVMLTVTNDGGATATAVQTVHVLNVAPSGQFGGAFIEFSLSLRMAGKKWSNVNVDVYKNYDETTGGSDGLVASFAVERWPGPPDQNPTNGGPSVPLRVDVMRPDTLTAVVSYDPYADSGDAIRGDQPVSGQIWGDNPVWLVLAFPDGQTYRIRHDFNVRQTLDRNRDTPTLFSEPWIVDLTAAATAGMPIEFVGTATEVGSDDVTFTWDFGDGTIASTTYLYDAARGPDPAYPPGSPYEPYLGGTVPPLNLVDSVTHAYANAGTYTVTLTVNDDDGGATVRTFDLTVAAFGPFR